MTASRPLMRFATASESDAVDAVVADAYGPGPELGRLREVRDAGALLFTIVAERDGALFAAAGVVAAELTSAAGAEEIGLIDPVAVHADARGGGVGRDLVRAIAVQGRKRGWPALIALGGGRFWEGVGFSESAAVDMTLQTRLRPLRALALTDAPLAGSISAPPAFETI